jgi:hypothetical protein
MPVGESNSNSMPVVYEIDKANRTIHTRCIGLVTIEEVIEHFRILQRDPDCPAYADVLLDLSKQTTIPTKNNLETVTWEIDKVRGTVRFGRCAIVACTTALYGMLRMFQVFTEAYFTETYVFRSISEAEKWLMARGSATLAAG